VSLISEVSTVAILVLFVIETYKSVVFSSDMIFAHSATNTPKSVKVNVKLSLCLTKYHALKMYKLLN